MPHRSATNAITSSTVSSCEIAYRRARVSYTNKARFGDLCNADAMTDHTPPTILVVEDDAALRGAIGRILRPRGFQTVGAPTTGEALELFQQHAATIRLAIIDMVLPGPSGLDLAAELERRNPSLHILYISGHVDSIAMDSIARRSPAHVLLKPFGRELLIERVESLLSVSNMPNLMQPWDRLIEASDQIGGSTSLLMYYGDTPAAFGIAVMHIAVLRAANIPYQFRRTVNSLLPISLTVAPDSWLQARRCVERIGLGADVALAA